MSYVATWMLIGVGGFAAEVAVVWLVTAVHDAVNVHRTGRPRHRRVYAVLAVAFFAKNLLAGPLAAWAGGSGFDVSDGYPWAHSANEALVTLSGYALDAVIMAIGVGNLAYWLFIRKFLVKEGFIPFRGWLVGLVPGVACSVWSVWTHTHQTNDSWWQSIVLVVLSVALLRFITWLKIVGLVKRYKRQLAGQPRRRMSLAACLGWGLLLALGSWLILVGLWVEGMAQLVGSVLLMASAMVVDLIRDVVQDRVEAPFEVP